jgi:hypothetical protein
MKLQREIVQLAGCEVPTATAESEHGAGGINACVISCPWDPQYVELPVAAAAIHPLQLGKN